MNEEHEAPRLSPRLRNALVADLVEKAVPDEVDRWLLARLPEHEWVEHLARQLGFRTTDGPGGIHDTLMLCIPELDRMLREWPLPSDGKASYALARAATKSLTSLESYATLLVGPGKWRRAT